MVSGVGLDAIEIARVAAVWEKWGWRFTGRIFTGAELAYCLAGGNPPARLAARLAAKEAAAKALGVGVARLGWRSIEVIKNERGAPGLALQGNAREVARRLGITSLNLSLAHNRIQALAVVVAEGKAKQP